MPKELREKLARRAFKKNMTQAELIRNILAENLDQEITSFNLSDLSLKDKDQDLNDLPEWSKAYLACYLDTDGYIGLGVVNYTQKRKPQIHPRINFFSKDLRSLEVINEWLGSFGIMITKSEPWKSQLNFSKVSHCRLIAKHTLPYLILKRKQAEILVEWRNGRIRTPYSIQDIELCCGMRALNHDRRKNPSGRNPNEIRELFAYVYEREGKSWKDFKD